MYIINMSEIAPALLVLYTGAMYISGLPIIISIRSTNVYEERSLGISKPEKEDEENNSEGSSKNNLHQTPGGSSSPSSLYVS